MEKNWILSLQSNFYGILPCFLFRFTDIAALMEQALKIELI